MHVVSVIIAVIAAVASVGAAVFSYISARRSERASDNIDRRRHLIEAHDKQVGEFRREFSDMMTAMGDVHDLVNMSTVLFRAELVRANPLRTKSLDAIIDNAVSGYIRVLRDPKDTNTKMGDTIARLRNEVREIHETADAKRADLERALNKQHDVEQ